MHRRGLTLLELVIVIAIIGILMAILLPAVQYARESARRTTCMSNVRQIMTAVQSYHGANRCFPPSPSWGSYGVHSAILPYIDMETAYSRIDTSVMVDQATEIRALSISFYTCPDDARTRALPEISPTNYAGNGGTGVQQSGYNGLFRPIESAWPGLEAGPLTIAEVTDGLSNTAAFGEILVGDGSGHMLRTNRQTAYSLGGPNELEHFAELCRNGPYAAGPGDTYFRGRPWADGNLSRALYNHVLPPQCPSCSNGGSVQLGAYTAASFHSNGVSVCFGDAHVDFISRDVDFAVWRALGSRDGSE